MVQEVGGLTERTLLLLASSLPDHGLAAGQLLWVCDLCSQQGPILRGVLHLIECFADTILKFLILSLNVCFVSKV